MKRLALLVLVCEPKFSMEFSPEEMDPIERVKIDFESKKGVKIGLVPNADILESR